MKKLLMAVGACVCALGAQAAVMSYDYVHDGLVGYWDGRENVGRGREVDRRHRDQQARLHADAEVNCMRKRESQQTGKRTPYQRAVAKNVHFKPVEGRPVGGGAVVRFESVVAAAAWAHSLGVTASFDAARHRLSEALRGLRKSAFAYKWRYVQA